MGVGERPAARHCQGRCACRQDGCACQNLGRICNWKVPTIRDAIVEAKTKSSLDLSGRPAYLMTLDQAAELAMFNSREYQDQREDLYLAARRQPVTCWSDFPLPPSSSPRAKRSATTRGGKLKSADPQITGASIAELV